MSEWLLIALALFGAYLWELFADWWETQKQAHREAAAIERGKVLDMICQSPPATPTAVREDALWEALGHSTKRVAKGRLATPTDSEVEHE